MLSSNNCSANKSIHSLTQHLPSLTRSGHWERNKGPGDDKGHRCLHGHTAEGAACQLAVNLVTCSLFPPASDLEHTCPPLLRANTFLPPKSTPWVPLCAYGNLCPQHSTQTLCCDDLILI